MKWSEINKDLLVKLLEDWFEGVVSNSEGNLARNTHPKWSVLELLGEPLSEFDKGLLVELLETWVDSIILNANGFFESTEKAKYTCADGTSVDPPDIGKLLEVYEKFGDDGVLAFQSKLRKTYTVSDSIVKMTEDQVLKQFQTDSYRAALDLLSGWIPFEDRSLDDDCDDCLE